MSNTQYLDKALSQIADRITVERLSERVPAIARMSRELEVVNQIMHRVATVLQKHQLTIMSDENTGLTVDGYEPEQAVEEVKQAFALLRMTAVRYQ